MTSPTLPPTLLALSPGDLTSGTALPGGTSRGTSGGAGAESFEGAARAAIEAGLRGILLREPALADGEYLALARRLTGALAAVDGWLGIHDRVHLARAAGAQGLHLGFRSLTPDAARDVVGAGIAIGFSSHAGDTARCWQCADYLFHGPVHATASKAGRLEPVGYEGLAQQCKAGPPVWGLGGLMPEHGRAVLATGARGMAVLGGIFGDREPGPSAAGYLTALAEVAS